MISHAVEHCAGFFNRKINAFFDLSRSLDWEITIDYTSFGADKWIKYEKMLEVLFHPIEKKTLDYERKVLKEELSDPTYGQEISEKILKKFVDPELSTNRYKSVTLKEVRDYHKKYYKPENIIVVDEDKNYKVIFKWFNPPKKKPQKLEKIKEKFKYRKDKYIVYVLKHYNAEQYRKLFLSYDLIIAYLFYINRLNNQRYYQQENYFFQNSYACSIVIEDADFSKLDKEFFEKWKKYYLNILRCWYCKETFFLNEYIYGIPKTRKEVIQIYKNFTREEFKEFLELK